MTKTQKFFKTIFPASWGESMEKESREWMMRCGKCGSEKSVWEYGGIRWKASGNPKRRMFCANCNENSTHETYRKN